MGDHVTIENLMDGIVRAEKSAMLHLVRLAVSPESRVLMLNDLNKIFVEYFGLCAALFYVNPELFALIINEKLSLYRLLWYIINNASKVAKLKTELLKLNDNEVINLDNYCEKDFADINEIHLKNLGVLVQFFKHTPSDVFSPEAVERLAGKVMETDSQLSKEEAIAKIFVESLGILYFILADVLALCDFEIRPLRACINNCHDFFITALNSNYALPQAPANLSFRFVECNGTYTLSSVQHSARK